MLDENQVSIIDAMNIARKYYPKTTYKHALRVAVAVSESVMIPKEYKDDCINLALMHELINKTNYDISKFPENFRLALEFLTKPEEMSYNDFCKKVKDTGNVPYKMCVYWVVLVDIKEHLASRDMLPKKPKDMYLNGLKILL